MRQKTYRKLRKIALIAIVPLSLGLAGIYWTAFNRTKIYQQGVSAGRVSQLRLQADQLTNGFWESVSTIRQVARDFKTQIASNPSARPKSPILHWAEYSVGARGLEEKLLSASSPLLEASRAVINVEAFEGLYFRSLVQELDVEKAKKKGVTTALVRPSQNYRKEWIAFAFYQPNPYRNTIVVALVNPTQAFPFIAQFRAQPDVKPGKKITATELRRAYLISAAGKILAHSQPSYAGADFSDSEVFTTGIRPSFLAATGTKLAKLRSIDRLPVTIRIHRLRNLPLALAVEHPLPLTRPKSAGWNQLMAGQTLALFGILLVLATAIWLIRRRRSVVHRDTVPTSAPGGIQVRGASTPLSALGETPAPPPSSLLSSRIVVGKKTAYHKPEFTSFIEQARNVGHQRVTHFERALKNIQDPALVANMLTELAGQLCASPVLFFRFDPRHAVANLVSDSGFRPGSAPVSLSFGLQSAALRDIRNLTRQGKMASLSSYPPLAAVLLERMGVAFFEAWALTGEKDLKGILVVLQAGLQSATHRDSLIRMIKRAAIAYNNRSHVIRAGPRNERVKLVQKTDLR